MAVVDSGGYAQAAEVLHKSQSAVTYAVQKIELMLGIKLFDIQGRKAVLTQTGHLLYRRAQSLLDRAADIEEAAQKLSAGWEAEINIAVEILFPNRALLKSLERFGEESPHTQIEVIESVIGGAPELLINGKVNLAISPRIPTGFLGHPLVNLRIVAAANPDHPLHKLGRELTIEDLRSHRHLIVRDTSANRTREALSVEINQRWTVSNLSTSIQAAKWGYGFAWFPEEKIREELLEGSLKPLPLRGGHERFEQLYLIVAKPDHAGPGTIRLSEIIQETTKNMCALYSKK